MRERGAIYGFGKFRQMLTLSRRVRAFMMDFEMFPSWIRERASFSEAFLVGSRAATQMHLCGAAGASAFGICPTRARAVLTCNIIADAPQSYLRADIARRYSELFALGWLGRCYLVVPLLFERLFPAVFDFTPYDDSRVDESGTEIFVTLKESSVVARGIPFHLKLSDDAEPALAGIGCDLASATESVSDSAVERAATMRAATALCNHINTERSLKRRVIRAVSQTIFERLTPVAAATRRGESLVACGPPLAFSPRRDLWAREGSTEKWLQQVSGYYFAQAFVQDVSFASEPASRFSFYWDPTEPMNSDNPTRNVNPEVIYCAFDQMTVRRKCLIQA